MLCDYGSCHVCEMELEKLGYQQCEDEIKRFTTLAYHFPEMVDLYIRQTITTKSDIWVRGRVEERGGGGATRTRCTDSSVSGGVVSGEWSVGGLVSEEVGSVGWSVGRLVNGGGGGGVSGVTGEA